MRVDLKSILVDLSKQQPIFHNEADFQHALAWAIREAYPEAKIRLEAKVHGPQTKVYLDILASISGRRYAIELKYKTRALTTSIDEEDFSLSNHGAQDTGRYDVLKDLYRLEQMVRSGVVDEGFLVFLTNDSSYYVIPEEEKNTADLKFRLHEGKRIEGTLSWGPNAGAGTTKGREAQLALEGRYELRWRSYSHIGTGVDGEFNYLLVPVGRELWFDMFVQSKQLPVSQNDLRDKLVNHLRDLGYSATVNRNLGNEKVDIWAEKGSEVLAIEVRNKTALLKTMYQGTSVDLKNQAAQDIGRYDFVSDISKMERVVGSHPGVQGFALLLTNDALYWTPPRNKDTADKMFQIFDGKSLSGECAWGDKASPGTMEGREEPVLLSDSYALKWRPYIELGDARNEQFQILIVRIE